MDPCAPLTDPQFNNAPILLDDTPSQFDDAGFDEAFFDDDFLSAMSSFNGDWPGAETSAFGFQMPDTGSHTLPSAPAAANMELPSPVPAAVGIKSQHNPAPIEPFTFLLTPITNIALANGALTVPYYVLCAPDVFEKGIKYTKEGLQSTFPVANACIHDASILAKQRLNTHGMKENSFRTACKGFIVEMVTVANHAGQPVELGRPKQE
jgi:hypothetical protein